MANERAPLKISEKFLTGNLIGPKYIIESLVQWTIMNDVLLLKCVRPFSRIKIGLYYCVSLLARALLAFYTVNRKKRGSTFDIITLEKHARFL